MSRKETDKSIELSKIGSDIGNGEVLEDPSFASEGKQMDADGRRNEATKATIHGLILILLRIAFYSACIVLVVRASHLVIPQCWSWLCEDQIQSIDKIFFSGALGGIIGRYANHVFKK